MTNWADLPNDLLLNIGDRLTSIESYDSFGAVCKSWRNTTTRDKNYLKHKTFQGLWFMLSEKGSKKRARGLLDFIEKPIEVRDFFSISSGKIRKIFLPEACSQKQCLSWKDWLLIVEADGVHTSILHIVSRVRIHLPDNVHGSITKFVVSANPNSTSDFIITVTWSNKLGFCKPGDTSWSTNNWYFEFADLFYDDNNKVYALIYCYGSVEFGHVNESSSTRWHSFWRVKVSPRKDEAHFTYVVKFSKNKYFLVHGFGDLSRKPYRTKRCEVYEMNIQDSTKPAKNIKNLGNKAIFLGGNSSYVVDCSEINNCKANCIYFSDDVMNIHLTRKFYASNLPIYHSNLVIYHMSDGTFESMYDKLMVPSNITTGPSWIGPCFLE